MNIKFNYMYRDYANYKNHNEVILSNPTNISKAEVEKYVKGHLIDGEWFYAKDWNVPDLHFEDWDVELDSPVHEFVSIEETNEPCNNNNNLTLTEFILRIKSSGNTWIS